MTVSRLVVCLCALAVVFGVALVDLMLVSWNQIVVWLRRVEGLRA